jgi:osmotically-inducible protein OsmY
MKTDDETRDDVISELRRDPQISDPEALGVAVTDGEVALTAHTSAYAGKGLSGAPRDDAGLARATAHVLEWNVRIPAGHVQATVQNGGVALKGHAGHDFQRREAERMVRHVRGVTGVTNAGTVAPPVIPERVEAQIEEAFKRRLRSAHAISGARYRSHGQALRARALGQRGERGSRRSRRGTRRGQAKNHLVVSP